MNVKLLGSIGVVRYSTELYKNLKNLNNTFQHLDQKMCTTMPFLGAGLAFPLQTSLESFNGYDIVHNLPCYPFLAKLNKDTMLVTTAHEFQAVLYSKLNAIQEMGIKDKAWTELVAKPGIKSALNSDLILANSIQTQKEAISLGVSRKKVILTSLGVDERFLRNTRQQQHNRKCFKIGFIGTLSPRKNVPFLIRSFKKIASNSIFLEMWGKSIYPQSYIENLIGTNKRIAWRGFAPETNFVRIYDSFDAFAYLSLYEGFGLPILEAKARGLPVIILKHSKISPEVRRDCFEIDTPEELSDIILTLKSNGYNETAQRKAMKNAQRFTWKKTAETTLSAYKTLC